MTMLLRMLTILFLVPRPTRTKQENLGYYTDCPRGCIACSPINGCLACQSDRYLHIKTRGMNQVGVCRRKCPRHHYAVRKKDISRCYRCMVPNCETCFSNTYCARCVAPLLTYKGKCVVSCPTGLHYAAYSKDCLPKVDCVVGDWASWSECTRKSLTCGYKYGSRSRTRSVLQTPSPSGRGCTSLTETNNRCRLKYRYCVDLLHNSSDPLKGFSKDLAKKYKRLLRKQRRREKKRRKKGKKGKKKKGKTDGKKGGGKKRSKKQREGAEQKQRHSGRRHGSIERELIGELMRSRFTPQPQPILGVETNDLPARAM